LTDNSPETPVPDHSLSVPDQAFLRRLAERILDSGLVTPAVFFLEMAKPLALVGSHALIFFGPIITAFVNADGYYRAARLLEEPAHVEWLLRTIERLDAERRRQRESEEAIRER
jgi:hypothetical protein